MGILIRSSDLRRPDRTAVAVARKIPGVEESFVRLPNGQLAYAHPGEVLYPRWVQTGPNSGRTVMLPTPISAIPRGWQSIHVRVPMRLASCAEVRCPYFEQGWNEMFRPHQPGSEAVAGDLTQDEAVARFGLLGPDELAPQLVWRPPGTPCPRIHKVPAGLPPIYEVDGRPTLWNEFEDALGGGIHQAQTLVAEGHN